MAYRFPLRHDVARLVSLPIYERWIAKFEKPRLKALSDLKQRLENTRD
jgi:hypothetical protein